MVGKVFTELVTRLHESFLESAPEGEEGELAEQLEALPMGVVQNLWFFLHPEGRLLAFNFLFDEVTAELEEERELAYGIRLGTKRFPELETLLLPCPAGASECSACASSGWTEGKDDLPCAECYGRGWLESE